MKILTFGDYMYVPYIVSTYRNLKSLNLHKNVVIWCTDLHTAEAIRELEPQSDVNIYTSRRYNLKTFTNDAEAYYCTLQYIKQEIIYDCINHLFDKVFYLDSDVIVFKDFFNIIEGIIEEKDLALKYYLQADRHNPGSLRNIVNCGTIGVKKTDQVNEMFDFFFNETKRYIPKGNLDEYHITNYVDMFQPKHGIIDDNVNLINNERMSYRVEDILQLSPMSFHPTYTINNFYPDRPYTKKGIAKDLNKWFYE